MTIAELELTEDALANALGRLSAEQRRPAGRKDLVLCVGSRALLRANRIVRSPGGPHYQIVPVAEDRRMDPDAWELRVLKRSELSRVPG